MAQRSLIISELKRSLREQGLTYAVVAATLELSIASVKRLFSAGNLSLERVDRICELLHLEIADLLVRARERPITKQLTLAQEHSIVADPTLFFIAWLVLNRTPFAEIAAAYRFSEREVLRNLIKLDRLKVIELQPGNQVRLLVNRHFSWRAGGPVQRHIHDKLLREFTSGDFDGPDTEFFFHGGEVSDTGLHDLQRVLQNAARQCAEVIERDRAPRVDRHGTAFVLALRRWNYSGFTHFKRATPPR